MSNIWTQCGGASELTRLEVGAWRVVEAQHQFATRKLVDSAEEQVLLEEMIEGAKPPDVSGDKLLHYLLSTPFRYPPLEHGSRFGTRLDRGIWYGSEAVRTALAEAGFYRLVFLDGTAADLGTVETRHTVFLARVATEVGVDLGAPTFGAYRAEIASVTDYGPTQALGAAMREADVEAFRYPSARDRSGGWNVGVFRPGAFRDRTPARLHDWYCATHRAGVEFRKLDVLDPVRWSFPREEYTVEGRLPYPPG